MPSVREDGLRDLLELAAPAPARPALPASEVRRRGDRRRRRSTALGAVVAVTAVATAAFVGVRILEPVPAGPDRSVATRPSPTPTPSGSPLRALEGTRWIPDLVTMGASTSQSYPDETANRPRALLTFEPGGVLVLDLLLPGRPAVTVRGTWTATSSTPVLDPALRAELHLDLVAPPGSPTVLVSLVSRLTTIVTAEGFRPTIGLPPSMAPMSLFLYGPMHTGVLGLIDQVRPEAALPSPYPSRP